MKRVVIIHRWEGSSRSDWLPWLTAELEKKGYEVLVPDMPETDVPVIEKWVSKLRDMVGTPDSDTYFIGHSIGAQTILRYLETISAEVGGALFVAGWFYLEDLEDEESAQIAKPWITTPIDIKKVKNVLPRSTLLISKDDPYDAFDKNIERFSQFVTSTRVYEHAGHFTEPKDLAILDEFEHLVQKN